MAESIPPWLNIGPETFERAASAGAAAGTAVGRTRNQALEASDAAQQMAARTALAYRAQENEMQIARERLSQAEHISAMESQVRNEIANRQFLLQQQRNAVDDAYKSVQIGLHQQQLQEQQYIARANAENAAQAFAANQGVARMLSQGRTLEEAIYANPMAQNAIVSSMAQSMRKPSDIQIVEEIQSSEQAANKAESAGDTGRAQQLRDRATMLRESMKGQQIVTGYDDQGRPIITMGKGAAPTVATQSEAQRKLLRYENSLELMNHLTQNLQAGHLGIRGLAGEYLLDRGLSQLVPELANQERVDARSALIAMREGMMREMSNDTRFSNADREEIARALPSSGAFESLPDARQRIDTVKRILIQRGKAYSTAAGMKTPPLWTLSSDEIQDLYRNNKISYEEALNALNRFH